MHLRFVLTAAIIIFAPLITEAKKGPGETLHWEVALGNLQGVRDLLHSGEARISDRSNIGDSALQGVCRRDERHPAESIAIANFLIERGADVNDTGRHGQNILWECAAGKAPKELIQFLVSKGGDLRLQTPGWQTPCDVLWTHRQGLARYFKCPRSAFVRGLKDVGTTTMIESGSACLLEHAVRDEVIDECAIETSESCARA